MCLKILVPCNAQMINFDEYVNENKTVHNKNWPYILAHSYRILIIGSSGSGKTNALLKTHRQISEKRCFKKYYSCDQACQFSAS